ncbi:MAG: hypothetical protein AAFO87_01620 [Cyanobacteria bacterium J06607_6]
MTLNVFSSLVLATLLIGCSNAANTAPSALTAAADAPTDSAADSTAAAAEPIATDSDSVAQTQSPSLAAAAQPESADLSASQSPTQPVAVAQPNAPAAETDVEIADSSSALIGYTSICEEGPCSQFYHTTPTLMGQSGVEQLFTVDLVSESSTGERLSGPAPTQVMCSTERPMVIKEIDAEYVIFHMAPHQITSDEDMNVTSLYWSVCHDTQADALSPDEMTQQARTLGYSLDRTFNVVYTPFFEPFEG